MYAPWKMLTRNRMARSGPALLRRTALETDGIWLEFVRRLLWRAIGQGKDDVFLLGLESFSLAISHCHNTSFSTNESSRT